MFRKFGMRVLTSCDNLRVLLPAAEYSKKITLQKFSLLVVQYILIRCDIPGFLKIFRSL